MTSFLQAGWHPTDDCQSTESNKSLSPTSGLAASVLYPPSFSGTPRHDHIWPILWQLHWLPVHHRVTFKIAVLVFQCLTGQAPAYLADDCQLTSNVRTRRLQSTDTAMCIIRCSNNTFGDQCFASAHPRLWNRLPALLRQCDSLGQFKRLLKTHLFGSWDRDTLWHFC